jgi:hypothetical protein
MVLEDDAFRLAVHNQPDGGVTVAQHVAALGGNMTCQDTSLVLWDFLIDPQKWSDVAG